jgi:DGQHR domain-containing protein
MAKAESVQKISVIVPRSPFVRANLQGVKHCLAALDVQKLMEWWPGRPHTPHRDPHKVTAIQRSLDWKRVAQIAAYLLQEEIVDVPARLDRIFREIYEPRRFDPGREWPPRVPQVVGFERSEYPTFANVLLHVNGAEIEPLPSSPSGKSKEDGAAHLVFDESNEKLRFSVIDGQHRINGAYFAVSILRRKNKAVNWEIPSEIFLDLDRFGAAPRHQAQIFIDVNFYQKKVDRSLVADLFPTARGGRGPLDDKERAQDIGRKLMLETGPLVGMIQIPGIKYGVRDVVTLATLNSAIEDLIDPMHRNRLTGLEEQTDFLAQCLQSWLEASGRIHDVSASPRLDPSNVAYQGRVLVSALTLLPACIWTIRKHKIRRLTSDGAQRVLTRWFRGLMKRAGLLRSGKFLPKTEFRNKGYLGSGGIGRFRDTLWAASLATRSISRLAEESKAEIADAHKRKIYSELSK